MVYHGECSIQRLNRMCVLLLFDDVIYMWNLKRDINGPTYEAETDWEQIHGCQGGGMDWEFRVQFSSVQSLSLVWLFVTPWTAALQASLSITNSWSSLKLMSIESMMPSNHLILCHPLLLLTSIFPSIRVFSNESALHIRWPSIEVSASTSVLPTNTQDWSPLGWSGWISLQSKGLLRFFSNTTVQNHQFICT